LREESRESKEGTGKGEEGQKRGGGEGEEKSRPMVISESRRLWLRKSTRGSRNVERAIGVIYYPYFGRLGFAKKQHSCHKCRTFRIG